jgi:hypothetical protein
MFVRNPAVRWLVVGLAAYALVLHALMMGVASAPRTSAENHLLAALQEICSGSGTAESAPGDPASSKIHASPCALCGLGHAAVDLPSVLRFVPPANIVETVALQPAPSASRPRLDFLAAARPRGPPAFA